MVVLVSRWFQGRTGAKNVTGTFLVRGAKISCKGRHRDSSYALGAQNHPFLLGRNGFFPGEPPVQSAPATQLGGSTRWVGLCVINKNHVAKARRPNDNGQCPALAGHYPKGSRAGGQIYYSLL